MSQRQVILGVSGVVVAAVLGGALWSAVEPRGTPAAPPVLVAETARQLPQSDVEIQLSFAPVVKQVTPAVVNVYATKTEQGFESPFASDPFFSRLFGGGDMFQSRPQTSQSLGSGVIIDPKGVIVTNSHVVSGADDIRIALSGGREFR